MIIGLVGKKENGKTTLAKALQTFLNDGEDANHPIVSFAAPLKNMLIETGICTKGEITYKKTEHSRKMLQVIGTEIVRKVDPDYWVKEFDRLVNAAKINDFIVDDVRFLNEARYIAKRNGILIRVVKSPLPEEGNTDTHQSEIELESIVSDLEFVNYFSENGMSNVGVLDLYRKIEEIQSEKETLAKKKSMGARYIEQDLRWIR